MVKCLYCDFKINPSVLKKSINDKSYHKKCYDILLNNDPYFWSHENTYKTICLSCETRYIKEKWLFNYCPVCKSKNLKEVKKCLVL